MKANDPAFVPYSNDGGEGRVDQGAKAVDTRTLDQGESGVEQVVNAEDTNSDDQDKGWDEQEVKSNDPAFTPCSYDGDKCVGGEDGGDQRVKAADTITQVQGEIRAGQVVDAVYTSFNDQGDSKYWLRLSG